MTTRTHTNVPQAALNSSAAAREAVVNEALRKVVNDGESLVDALDAVFHVGFNAGYQELGENVADVSRSLALRAGAARAGRELGDTDPGDYAAGLEAARAMLRRFTGIA